MRLIISQFLRTLRERDEFDRLLPDLLLAMGYVPLAKPQTGVRQHGVDLAATGKSAEDGVDELLLFVIKRGDIGRRDWDNGEPTSVRPSLNEVLDVYLTSLIAPEHKNFRKTIVLATTGDFKQDAEVNWVSFRTKHSNEVAFDFWGADRVSDLIERHMLDEHLFVEDDRTDLRKALALAGDPEYDFRDLLRLLLRQLGLKPDGTLTTPAGSVGSLGKAIRRAHLASQICASWAQSEGDSRRAIWVAERMLLWTWHRIQLLDTKDLSAFDQEIANAKQSYVDACFHYFEQMRRHVAVKDGMAGYTGEGAEFAVVLFEHLGLLAAMGLATQFEVPHDEETAKVLWHNANAVADATCALISNNPAIASPRLDGQIVDVTLALMFLLQAERTEQAKTWLAEISARLDYCFRTRSRFPISTDSFTDLVEFEVTPGDESIKADLMSTSWCLATIAAWCAKLGLNLSYQALSRGSREAYSNVCAQLWHPTKDLTSTWYFGGALRAGIAEAPYDLPTEIETIQRRIADFLTREEYDWVKASPAYPAGLFALDLIACRHFRMPVPASIWYQFAPIERGPEATATPAG